ncbi:MAG: methionyl-tRNA formyltransferase [Planctomycetes bacterium]|nr:methionyl-tRNA formyltransferase [Planctomycetota bacterium]
MRTIFAGAGRFAVPALERLAGSPHAPLRVYSRPDRPAGRGHRLRPAPAASAARRLGLRLEQPERIRDRIDEIRSLQADLIVVADYGELLDAALLDAARLGAYNLHASLLPRHRGASPVPYAILEGDAETGVTIFRLVRRLDAGPVLASRATPIGPDERGEALEGRLAFLAADLLADVLPALEAGPPPLAPQDESCATLAPKLAKDDGRIRWEEPAARTERRIRAMDPWPKAFTFLVRPGEPAERTGIVRAHPVPGDRGAPPGEIIAAADEGILVACGAGALLIEGIQPAGRRAMPAAAYLRGHALPPGSRFLSEGA